MHSAHTLKMKNLNVRISEQTGFSEKTQIIYHTLKLKIFMRMQVYFLLGNQHKIKDLDNWCKFKICLHCIEASGEKKTISLKYKRKFSFPGLLFPLFHLMRKLDIICRTGICCQNHYWQILGSEIRVKLSQLWNSESFEHFSPHSDFFASTARKKL